LIEKVKKYQVRGAMRRQEPMAKHTSWRVGGPADNFYIPADVDDLQGFLKSRTDDEPYLWLGLGSNLLVRDGGFRGTVISVMGVLAELTVIRPGVLRVGAGVTCAKLARFAAHAGYDGAEFLAGIPGSFGGALAMNAGAFGGTTWDLVSHAETVDHRGEIRTRTRSDLQVGYRSVRLPGDEWFIAGELILEPGDPGTARNRIRKLLAQRSRSQPTGASSCGSVFRNPEGDYAGRLIDACGLKGFRIGKASVSKKHANFIINEGGATAGEIEALIHHIQQVVLKEHGVRLELEVRIMGATA
jgi:UDP-N-acetylmuramate dehydrogenase